MRWLRFPAAAGAALLLVGLVCASPAAAQKGPDHLHVDLAQAGCGTLRASGFELPANTRLSLRFLDGSTGRTLRQASARTGAEGTLTFSTQVPLTGVSTVRMTVARPGADKPFAFSELTIPGPCPLPFTGPGRWPTLAALALCLILAGSLLLGVFADRGRHLAGRSAP
jgi:hypothetical protein